MVTENLIFSKACQNATYINHLCMQCRVHDDAMNVKLQNLFSRKLGALGMTNWFNHLSSNFPPNVNSNFPPRLEGNCIILLAIHSKAGKFLEIVRNNG